MSTINVYEIITNRMIESLNASRIPWVKPWSTDNRLSMNFITKKPYRGINAILTNYSGFTSPYWLTYKQASSLGGQVKSGSKSTPIVYYAKIDKHQGTINESSFMLARYFNAFNLDQIDGIIVPPVNIPLIAFNPIEEAERIVKGYSLTDSITFNEQRAYYRPSTDVINMPKRESFINEPSWYSTLFHEMGHSTGHVTRLNREGVTSPIKFGSHLYSKEELIAEMTASFLCASSGINSQFEQSVAYIQGWIQALKGDSKLVMQAASQAQKASDLILGIQPEAFTQE